MCSTLLNSHKHTHAYTLTHTNGSVNSHRFWQQKERVQQSLCWCHWKQTQLPSSVVLSAADITQGMFWIIILHINTSKLKRFGSFMEILNNFSRLGTEDARRRNTVADRSCLFFCDLAASPTLRARSSNPCRSQLVRCCHPATLKSKFL